MDQQTKSPQFLSAFEARNIAAALYFWQTNGNVSSCPEWGIATNNSQEDPMSDADLTALAKRFQGHAAYNPDFGDDLREAHEMVDYAADLLKARKAEARGDLDEVASQTEELVSDLQELVDDIICSDCGAFNNDGEGEDGLCGNCADAKCDADDERSSDERASERPHVGDEIVQEASEGDSYIEIGRIPSAQPNIANGIWQIEDQYGDTHWTEHDGDRWVTIPEPAETAAAEASE